MQPNDAGRIANTVDPDQTAPFRSSLIWVCTVCSDLSVAKFRILWFMIFQWKWNKKSLQVIDVVVDPYLSYHLRPHQREGVTFLYECVMGYRNFGGYGAILA